MAAYTRLKLVIAGTIKTAQTWSIGFDFAPSVALTSSDMQIWLNTIATGAVTTWWNGTNGPRAVNPTSVNVTNLRAYYYQAGFNTAAAQAQYTYTTPLTGLSGAWLPTQTSMVLTKQTAQAGRSYRGRAYLPAIGATLTNLNYFATADITAVAALTATMLTDFNNDTVGTGSITAIVATQLLGTPGAVNAIRVDNEPDIQRRRADKIAPSVYVRQTV